MSKSYNKRLSAFLAMCLLAAMVSSCRTATTPGQPNGQQQGQQGQNMQQGQNIGQYLRADESGDITGNAPQPGPDANYGTTLGDNLGNNQGYNLGANQQNQQMAPDRQKADKCKNLLGNMEGVADTNVIVMGNTALVGFKPTAEGEQDINATKNMIINKIKENDNTITNVTVSEQPDVMNRMRRLGEDITNNRPINNISNDFMQIIRGVTPASR